MSERFLLFVVAVMFILSLIGAYVLFKYLKSSALIKREGYKAGGAIAGFLLIYGILFYSFDSLLKYKPQVWSITGTVIKEGTTSHDAIVIKQVPPKPCTFTDESGSFRLDNIQMTDGDELPEIYITCEGFNPVNCQINKENAVIKYDKKEIKVKDAIKIIRKKD